MRRASRYIGWIFQAALLFTFLLFPVFPSDAGPSAAWTETDKLISEQKFQAALDKVDVVLADAKKSSDTRLWTEALIRSTQLKMGLHSYETAVRDFKAEAWPKDPAGRVLLNLYYAHALMRYQQMYGWEIGQREKTVSAEKIDLKAWTLSQIGEEINRNFDDVMKNGPALDQPAPTFFDAYIEKNNYPKGVRPVLRDVVVYMAIRHLANSQYWTPRESAEVYRNDVRKLSAEPPSVRIAAADAVRHPLLKMASWLGEHRAFHKKSGRPEAALEAQYELFEVLHRAMTEEGDRALITKALQDVQANNRSIPWWSRGQALLAEFIRETSRPGRLIEVRDEALKGMKAFPESVGGKMCATIVSDVERPDYSVIAMSSDALSRRSILVNYKNLTKMYFRAYPFDLEKAIAAKRNGGDIFDLNSFQGEVRLGSVKPVAEWNLDLQATPDFARHRKFVTPPLKKVGAYVVLVSSRPDFSGSNDVVQAVRILVSDLVMATDSNNDSQIETRVLSGEKGLAVSGAKVSLYRFTWTTAPVLVETKSSNQEGYVAFREPKKAANEYWNYFLVARHADSVAMELDRVYFSREAPPSAVQSSLIYTDRSIYRPGQKLLWKVVAYKGKMNEGDYTVASKGTELSVRLLDPNRQAVDKKTIKVGEFGTASGEFLIPAGRPLGGWMLDVTGPHAGGVAIRVEEYKRPTFESKLKDVAEPARLNRKLKIEGEAKYYFGLPVSNGTVAWRVTRQEMIPSWSMWRNNWFRPQRNSADTIASGTANLKSDGSFVFEFTPQADERKASKNDDITYSFNVEANVTDEAGETRTATRVFRLGFVSVEADLTTAKSYFKVGDTVSIAALLKTLDGKARAGAAKFKIFRLKQPAVADVPSELARDASEPSYGYEGTSDAADLTRFATPDDRKRARWETSSQWESVVSRWSDGDEVAAGELKHDEKGLSEIEAKDLSVGVYRLQYEAPDDFGAVFKRSKSFIVASPKPALALPLIVLVEKNSVEVGDKARVLLHSGLPGQSFLIETFRDGRRLTRKTWTSGKDSSILEFPIHREDRGGFTISVSGVRDHQFLHEEVSVAVPWTDRGLTLEFATFRDSIRPGATETFKVTVKSSDKKNLAAGAAEVLAYMYDRSLDVFAPHEYPKVLDRYPSRMGAYVWNMTLASQTAMYWSGSFATATRVPPLRDDVLKFQSGYGIGGPGRRQRAFGGSEDSFMEDAVPSSPMAAPIGAVMKSARNSLAESDGAISDKMDSASLAAPLKAKAAPAAPAATEVRSNFSETAFFKPHLLTGRDGSVSFEFTVPDSVTSWNVLAHAITKDLRGGSVLKETKSVKDLMVRTYAPRFLREGDEAEIKVSISNALDISAKGDVVFDIENPETGKSVAALFGLKPQDLKKSFSIAKKGSMVVGFSVKTPRDVGTYAFRAIAKSKNFSDGELKPFPVLPSRMHLAQSRFVVLKNKDAKTLEFKDLALNDDPSRINEKMVVNVDAQLFYGVLQSLPYLVEYPYECVEQTLNRFLSTGIVSSVFKKYPSVATMAKEMSTRHSQLEKFDGADANRRMKLEESPWLEAAQGGRDDAGVASILDQRVSKDERDRALARLRKMQLPNGAFPWFEGGAPDQYMTLYVLMGFGRGLEFQVDVPKEVVTKAWGYTRKWLDENIERMMTNQCCWETITMISYAASLYPDASWTAGLFDEAYRKRLVEYGFKNWKKHSPLLKGYLALTLKRMNRPEDAKLVWDSVMDSAKSDDQLGTYWAAEDRSWLWYNDTVETHAFSLRALMELSPQDKRSEGLVQWLFLNKKMNHWKSTRATAEAIYALVHYLDQTKTLGVREVVSVDAGVSKTQFVFDPDKYTGKKNQVVIEGDKISAKTTSKIKVEKATPGFAFASATWHFSTDRLPKEDRGDFFNVSRRYFKRELVTTAAGAKEWTIKPLAEGDAVRVGDQIEVQISLKTKHEAEYVHLRDPRAAGLEPESLISGYKWDLGLSWFEEIRDSGSNFFFNRLPVGEYTFKYRLRANMAGSFKIGPATVQSMYAPEFNAYSAGAVMKIEAAAK